MAYSYSTENQVGYVVQVVGQAWDAFSRVVNLAIIGEILSPYIMYRILHVKFDLLEPKQEGFALLSELDSLLSAEECIIIELG